MLSDLVQNLIFASGCSLDSILSEDSLALSSFEAIASSLHQRFNKNEHFQIGSAMVWYLLLLLLKDMLNHFV